MPPCGVQKDPAQNTVSLSLFFFPNCNEAQGHKTFSLYNLVMLFEIDLCNKIYLLLIFFLCGKRLAKLRTAQGKIENYCTSLDGKEKEGEKRKESQTLFTQAALLLKITFFFPPQTSQGPSTQNMLPSERRPLSRGMRLPPTEEGRPWPCSQTTNCRTRLRSRSVGETDYSNYWCQVTMFYIRVLQHLLCDIVFPHIHVSNIISFPCPHAVLLLQPVLLLLLLAASRLRSGGGALPARGLRGGRGGAGGLRRRGLDDDGG